MLNFIYIKVISLKSHNLIKKIVIINKNKTITHISTVFYMFVHAYIHMQKEENFIILN